MQYDVEASRAMDTAPQLPVDARSCPELCATCPARVPLTRSLPAPPPPGLVADASADKKVKDWRTSMSSTALLFFGISHPRNARPTGRCARYALGCLGCPAPEAPHSVVCSRVGPRRPPPRESVTLTAWVRRC